MELTKEELQEVAGGGLKLSMAGALIFLGGAAAFAIGVVKGLMGAATCSLRKK